MPPRSHPAGDSPAAQGESGWRQAYGHPPHYLSASATNRQSPANRPPHVRLPPIPHPLPLPPRTPRGGKKRLGHYLSASAVCGGKAHLSPAPPLCGLSEGCFRLSRCSPFGFPLVVGCGLRQGAVIGLPRNSYLPLHHPPPPPPFPLAHPEGATIGWALFCRLARCPSAGSPAPPKRGYRGVMRAGSPAPLERFSYLCYRRHRGVLCPWLWAVSVSSGRLFPCALAPRL